MSSEEQRLATANTGQTSTATMQGALFTPRPARRRGETVLTPEAPTFLLKEDFANIHAFTALSDCAVLDVLMPPYGDEAERDCHYFEEIAAEGEATGLGTRLLRSIAPPASLDIRRGEYCGPIVQPDDVAALKRRWPR
uniref:Uncharacterized protein n=1 Tax=Haptolina ericina TaxID=156174 RepID=A0A7S3ESC5_9EUKA|mmetsp:Transcript_15246/g.34071  ORF Transcript_15246/g.34071 Transcript_15246/m.34071 type:complete len:138 (+) Transcript_15246:530-943(+)|eukprot:CAMPEP_0181176966 /NCGR_PEP_ID=MMETSP1096-20121128/4911_1 /TAXON_ID=156174 ORGANISM="Chrysochromulina ericina, Strain CCMP281" /NCGR_SAMPLE_ID=MMETSP1096 /ASSEMBLY_ACC=CAM_ASM_000453 /LENGTH=137 /DNA_ID=CAMNT_0023265089 /DNA_START=462 /DNA_END=875 /DNA_ORIENTATION=+